jgi:flagellar basal body P-ring formation protein FlgA
MKAGNYLCFFSLILSLFFVSNAAGSADYVELEDLAKAAQAYLKKQVNQQSSYSSQKDVSIKSHTIDSRLQLKQCDKPLTFSHNQNTKISGTTSVKVSCSGPMPWAIYTKHFVSIKKSVLVINKNLPRGHIVTDNDINYSPKKISTLRNGYISDKSFVLGSQLKRPVREGQPIYSHQIEPVELIKKGDKVNISAKVGSLTVVTSGTALNNGRKGEQIDVKNLRSSRVIRTKIIGVNTVEVIL